MLNYLRELVPVSIYRNGHSKFLSNFRTNEAIEKRIAYYNQLTGPKNLQDARTLSSLSLKNSIKNYYFDLKAYTRYFDQNLKGHFLFGDITNIPDEPSLVKSRPVSIENHNAVLLKWNKIRHYTWIKDDPYPFNKKLNNLVGRGKIHKHQMHRISFFEQYFDHPLCNIGKVNHNQLPDRWTAKRMTIDEQLRYKFILCLEGNDVASNLKWVMSSGSIAVMPEPRYETWFMEGKLIPDYHYISLRSDYSDLDSKLEYYINNPKEALNIIRNANAYITPFQDKRTEDYISLRVLEKYFKLTN